MSSNSDLDGASLYRRPLGPVRDLRATTEPAPDLQSVELDWGPPQPDRVIDYYTIYGSRRPDFAPGTASLLARSPVSFYRHSELGPDPETWYYRVVAVDAARKVGSFKRAPQVAATTAAGLRRIPRERLRATATSQHVGYEAARALDGDPATIWHSEWQPPAPLPQSITIDLGANADVEGLTYLPRQDGNQNGIITEHAIYASDDDRAYIRVTAGNWAGDATTKSAMFSAPGTRYVRLEAIEGGGGYAAGAEINLFGPAAD